MLTNVWKLPKINVGIMNNLALKIFNFFFGGGALVWQACSDLNDKNEKIYQENGLKIIETEYKSSNKIVFEFFNESGRKISVHHYNNGYTTCDSNMFFRNKINEFPDEIENYDESDSIVSKIDCVKIGGNIIGNQEKNIYDCVQVNYDPFHRNKIVHGIPGATEKAVQRMTHLRIDKDCNGVARIPILENVYDYKKNIVEKLVFNQVGGLESVSSYIYPRREIYEKKLYIDGEYIKTKCYANDSLKIEAREFFDEKQSCFD